MHWHADLQTTKHVEKVYGHLQSVYGGQVALIYLSFFFIIICSFIYFKSDISLASGFPSNPKPGASFYPRSNQIFSFLESK